MKNRLFLAVLTAIVFLCILPLPAAALSGSGTASDPYIVSTPADLNTIYTSKLYTSYFVQTNDINMVGVTSWSSIGSSSTPFTGDYNGGGYKIYGLTVRPNSGPHSVFNYIGAGGHIHDLTVSDSNFIGSTTTNGYAAGICAFAKGGQISNCNVINCTIKTTAGYAAAGICALNTNSVLTISNCNVINCVIGKDSNTGSYGSAGILSTSTYTYSVSSCTVSNTYIYCSNTHCAGICMMCSDSSGGESTITNCIVDKSTIVSGDGSAAGVVSNQRKTMVSDSVVSQCSIISRTNGAYNTGYCAAGVISTRNSAVSIYMSAYNCSSISNNIYGFTYGDIAPDGMFDAQSTSSDITHQENKYLMATSLNAEKTTGLTVAYTINGQRGAAVVSSSTGAIAGMDWNYGDGVTARTDALTYTYPTSGEYTTTVTLTNVLDGTGITLTGPAVSFGIDITSVSADIYKGGIQTEINLTAEIFEATSQAWSYSTDGTTWFIIGSRNPQTWTPGLPGTYQVKVTAYNAEKPDGIYKLLNRSISIYQAPAVSNVQVTPENGALSETITLSATVDDPGVDTTEYAWQISSDGGASYTRIASSSPIVILQNFDHAGDYLIRLSVTGTGGTTESLPAVYHAWNAPTVTATIDKTTVILPATVYLTATGTDIQTYTWYHSTDMTNWIPISQSSSVSYSVPNDPDHYFYVQVSGYGGIVDTSSHPIHLEAGFKPVISIISPANGKHYDVNERIQVTGTAESYDSFYWDWGDASAVGDTHSLSTDVTYGKSGSAKVITLTAVNRYGTTTATVKVSVSPFPIRPSAEGPVEKVDTSGFWNLTHTFEPDENGQPDILGFIRGIFGVYTDLIGGIFFVVLFGVPYLIMWIYQKNLLLPSIIGVLFGGWMFATFPSAYILPALGILALSIAGGIYAIVHR